MQLVATSVQSSSDQSSSDRPSPDRPSPDRSTSSLRASSSPGRTRDSASIRRRARTAASIRKRSSGQSNVERCRTQLRHGRASCLRPLAHRLKAASSRMSPTAAGRSTPASASVCPVCSASRLAKAAADCVVFRMTSRGPGAARTRSTRSSGERTDSASRIRTRRASSCFASVVAGRAIVGMSDPASSWGFTSDVAASRCRQGKESSCQSRTSVPEASTSRQPQSRVRRSSHSHASGHSFAGSAACDSSSMMPLPGKACSFRRLAGVLAASVSKNWTAVVTMIGAVHSCARWRWRSSSNSTRLWCAATISSGRSPSSVRASRSVRTVWSMIAV